MKKFFIIAIAAIMVATTPLADFSNGFHATNVYAAVYDAAATESIANRIHSYMQPYLGTNTLTNYSNGTAIQCHALVNYVWKNVFGCDVYSGNCKTTPASTDYANLGTYVNTYAKPGDILRVDRKHSLVITSFDANTVTGYEWLYNRKERLGTYTWDGVKAWGNGSQSYWLYQVDDTLYNSIASDTSSGQASRGDWFTREDDAIGTITLQIGNPKITVNGVDKPIDSLGSTPIIVNGTTLVPIRAVIEGMGGGVAWDGPKQIISLCYNGNFVYLTVGNNTMVSNNQNLYLPTPATLYFGTTLLPIRSVIENMDGAVAWDNVTQTMTIKYLKAQ